MPEDETVDDTETEDPIEPVDPEDPEEPEEPEKPEEPEEPKPNTMLDDIKAMCGITRTNTDFDIQIKIHANGALSSLRQLGTFSGDLYLVTDECVWNDLEIDPEIQALAMEYICLKTRAAFDPPQASSLETAITGRLDELEFRINVLTDTRAIKEEETDDEL